MNAIKKVFNNSFCRDKDYRSAIVKRLGYSNHNKGLRRLDNLLNYGKADDKFIKKLCSVLQLDERAMYKAISSLNHRKECAEDLKRRKVFKPHIWIKHEREYPPLGSVSIVGLLGIDRFKKIPLNSKIVNLPWSQQVREIKRTINQDKAQNSQADVIFGEVIGYTYRKEFDVSFCFDVSGNITHIYPVKPKISEVAIIL